MPDNPLARLMSPRSVVVAGASNNFTKMGSVQALNLIHGGYDGDVFFLHPTDDEVLGHPAYRDPADLPIAPDLALLVTPTKVTPGIIDGLGRRGVRLAVIITAGFGEVGDEGKALEKELLAAADRHGMRFLGPNCMGIINTAIGLNVTFFPYRDRPGHLGLISQSGTYVTQTLPYLEELGIRYSQAISVGNASNIDVVDCLDHLGDDPDTHAIAIYVEGIKRGREFIETARRVSAKKPIVALYVGGTEAGSRSCMSHTASMGAPDALFGGVFEQAGIIRASTIEDLYGWGHAFASMPSPRGDRMAILTHSGGPATSMADACERAGLKVPVFSDALQAKIRALIEPTGSARNPVDLTFSRDYHTFVLRLPEILFASDEVDGVLMHGVMDTGFAKHFYDLVSDKVSLTKEEFVEASEFDLTRLLELPTESGKPLVAANFLSDDHAAGVFRDNDIPLFKGPERAVEAMGALFRYGKARRAAGGGTAPADETAEAVAAGVSESITAAEGVLDEYESMKLLERYGVPVALERRVAEMEEALAAAREIGYPVVLKGLAPGVAHKTEAGLVHADVRSDSELEAAWHAIEENAPGCARIVAAMLAGSRELVVGMARFPGFGACVMLGIGGLFTEAIRDVTFRCAPVTIEEAMAMPDSLGLRNLFDARRGEAEVDRAVLARTIRSVGRLALEHPEIAEIDINPLIVTKDGNPVAADALVVLTGRSGK